MFGSLGLTEILLIVGVVVILFGAKQLPKVGRAMGESIREFRKVGAELTGAADEVRDTVEDLEDDVRETVGAPKKRRGRRARV
jgi:sec-independent protein translocase protein TatA